MWSGSIADGAGDVFTLASTDPVVLEPLLNSVKLLDIVVLALALQLTAPTLFSRALDQGHVGRNAFPIRVGHKNR